MAYAAAGAAPNTFKKLFCYCGCDVEYNHRNLLDCFKDTHASDCPTCVDEALLAFKLDGDKTPLSDIQKSVDDKFSAKYFFNNPSPALIEYRRSRLYTSNATPATVIPNAPPCCNGAR